MTETSIVITVAVGIIGCVIAVVTYFAGRQSAGKAEAREMGSLLTDLRYIKDMVDSINRRLGEDVGRLEGRVDQVSKQLSDVSETAGRAHESAKMVHSRLNEHLEREHGQRGRGGGEA